MAARAGRPPALRSPVGLYAECAPCAWLRAARRETEAKAQFLQPSPSGFSADGPARDRGVFCVETTAAFSRETTSVTAALLWQRLPARADACTLASTPRLLSSTLSVRRRKMPPTGSAHPLEDSTTCPGPQSLTPAPGSLPCERASSEPWRVSSRRSGGRRGRSHVRRSGSRSSASSPSLLRGNGLGDQTETPNGEEQAGNDGVPPHCCPRGCETAGPETEEKCRQRQP